jgi:hypothetical protein
MIGAWMLAYLYLLANGAAEMNQYWILIGFGMLFLSYLMMRPRKRKDPLGPAPRLSLTRERGVEREMQNLLVDLTQMAQKISAQLDTRSAKLEALIKEADEKIAKLSSIKPTSNLRLVETRQIEAETMETDARYLEIYTMADHGAAVRDIAQKLSKPAGEVELILALRPNRTRQIQETNEA